MNPFDKILERLEEIKGCSCDGISCSECEYTSDCLEGEMSEKVAIDKAVEIVQEVAEEYNDGWIPCSERLPEEAFGCLVTVMDCEPVTQNEFENILPYFVGYDGHSWNDADGNEIPFEVIAWQPLPKPFTEIKQ